MMTELTRKFLQKEPSDEEMITFLDEHYSERHLVPDDIISIIQQMKDVKNMHKSIYKYAQGDLLFFKRDEFLNIIGNINDQRRSEILESVIIQRFKEQMEAEPNNSEQIAHSIYGYLNLLQNMGITNEENDYIDRVKEIFEEMAQKFNKNDLLTFLFNTDLTQWRKEELYKYEHLLEKEDFGELLEEWQNAQSSKSKAIVNDFFEEAEKKGLPLEKVTIDFLETAKSRGLQMNELYEWIIKNYSGELIIEQRAEMQEGLTVLKGKEQEQLGKNE